MSVKEILKKNIKSNITKIAYFIGVFTTNILTFVMGYMGTVMPNSALGDMFRGIFGMINIFWAAVAPLIFGGKDTIKEKDEEINVLREKVQEADIIEEKLTEYKTKFRILRDTSELAILLGARDLDAARTMFNTIRWDESNESIRDIENFNKSTDEPQKNQT